MQLDRGVTQESRVIAALMLTHALVGVRHLYQDSPTFTQLLISKPKKYKRTGIERCPSIFSLLNLPESLRKHKYVIRTLQKIPSTASALPWNYLLIPCVHLLPLAKARHSSV